MIVVQELVKKFGDFTALDRVELHTPRGSIYGLVGPNGAGKSTLIRHLLGIFRPDGGTVTIDGQNVWENESLKSRMAFIPDEIFFFPQANLREMRRFYQGLYPRFDEELWKRLSEVFRLPEDLSLRRFSKGMQKQAAFYLSVCSRPDILILDEPVDGLDPVMRRQVWAVVMAEVAQRDTTVLVSSHNLRELEDVCDHVGIMDKGSMLLERSLEELQENVCKVQVVPGAGGLPEGLDILHKAESGRLMTLILRGAPKMLEERIASAEPVYFDLVPLSLEEIFIYELGGVNSNVKDVVL